MQQGIIWIAGRRCSIFRHGQNGSVIYWGVSDASGELSEKTAALLCGLLTDKPWTLVAYEVPSWNDDFSPWPAPAVFGKEDFSGNAKGTLDWLIGECIPRTENQTVPLRLIGGYSLAGLFSLWAFYESQMFQGVASCSGSLWYPGWDAYMQDQTAPNGSVVYLSLGTKEEHPRNRTMSAVGDVTRRQMERTRADARVRASMLAWHPGGHFSNADERMAQGFAWLLNHIRIP